MPRNLTGKDDEFKEEDLSDFEDERELRRNKKKKSEKQAPKYIDDTYMIGSKKHLRACLYCRLVLNREKWVKIEGCPNCEESTGVEETSDQFESLIALIFPKVSWVAEF